ncbi:hypothetical protein GFL38_32635 [Rhizobium leguminosarum bv. viciae]|uniref:hypothetical protein n=1 Tax=Rhizobium ruizarguesonis TaxID=2081791 RepID=UPI00143F39E7|nr:hypothetical protein [Rhizobium ruizarguesonis]NKJ76920.1 hypothetical protein [Rhizobium leguminosarum bv. viciae]NKQ74957.1 hypothetical protein [Rhizobium ruizarguesonis]NKQ82042.1 hypothetical protein [Rhizobium ruizarguesonis]
MGSDDRVYGSPRHGFARPSMETTTARREAAREVMRAFEDGPSLERFPLLREAAGLMAEVFFMIREQKRAEWFLTSGMMSHPTPHIARSIGKRFQQIALSCERRDVGQVVEHLSVMRAPPTRLENYLACTRARDQMEPVDDARWVYLVRNKTEWGVVNLGEIDGRVQDALQELEDLNPHFGKYNLAAAWRVHDLRAGYAIAAMALQPAFIQTDFYDFRDFEQLAEMRKKVTNALQDYRLLDGSPSYVSSSWSADYFRNSGRHLALEETEVDEEVVDAVVGFAP